MASRSAMAARTASSRSASRSWPAAASFSWAGSAGCPGRSRCTCSAILRNTDAQLASKRARAFEATPSSEMARPLTTPIAISATRSPATCNCGWPAMPLLESTINAAIGALRIEGRHALAPASRATMASVAAVEDKSRWCCSQTPAARSRRRPPWHAPGPIPPRVWKRCRGAPRSRRSSRPRSFPANAAPRRPGRTAARPLPVGGPGVKGSRSCAAGRAAWLRRRFRGFGHEVGFAQSVTSPVAQYVSRSGRSSCRMVVAISSIDFVVVDSQRIPARRIMASASLTSWRQFSMLA